MPASPLYKLMLCSYGRLEMAASALQNLPPWAAAAVTTRIDYPSMLVDWQNADPKDVLDHPYSLRMSCSLTLSYETRKVGAGRQTQVGREDGPYVCLGTCQLLEPVRSHSYEACRDAVHKMLVQTPRLGEFDLGPENWRSSYLPHDVAMYVLNLVRDDLDERGVARSYVFDMQVSIRITIEYSKPKALLLACKFTAPARNPAYYTAECAICAEDLAKEKDTDGVVTLPCSHAFHSRCVALWFYKGPTCPYCRRDTMKHFSAINPGGKFPSLSAS